jgi:outer membrane biosynthesis protein TonB
MHYLFKLLISSLTDQTPVTGSGIVPGKQPTLGQQRQNNKDNKDDTNNANNAKNTNNTNANTNTNTTTTNASKILTSPDIALKRRHLIDAFAQTAVGLCPTLR